MRLAACAATSRAVHAGGEHRGLRAKIRDIKDFPVEGILFEDITLEGLTTLLKDAAASRT